MALQTWHIFIILIGLTYLLGSVPFGLVVGLAKGVDVRKAGSGNIGATNVGRLLGRRYFFIVFVLDLSKSMVPMLIGTWLADRSPANQLTYILWLSIGFAAIIGHMFSVFLGFKGGKGVATSAGVMVGLWPYYTVPSIFAISGFCLILYVTRYMSIASMSGAMMFPVVYTIIALNRQWDPFGKQLPLLLFAILMGLLVVYRHRANIARLRAGTESRIGQKKRDEVTPKAPDDLT